MRESLELVYPAGMRSEAFADYVLQKCGIDTVNPPLAHQSLCHHAKLRCDLSVHECQKAGRDLHRSRR